VDDFWGVLVFFVIAAVFFSIYLFKVGKAKQLLSEAEKARAGGDDRSAVGLFKQALWKSNESPAMERKILSSLDKIYKGRTINHDFTDYGKLVGQLEILKKKSSQKAMGEMGQVQKLKKALIDEMPDLS